MLHEFTRKPMIVYTTNAPSVISRYNGFSTFLSAKGKSHGLTWALNYNSLKKAT